MELWTTESLEYHKKVDKSDKVFLWTYKVLEDYEVLTWVFSYTICTFNFIFYIRIQIQVWRLEPCNLSEQ